LVGKRAPIEISRKEILRKLHFPNRKEGQENQDEPIKKGKKYRGTNGKREMVNQTEGDKKKRVTKDRFKKERLARGPMAKIKSSIKRAKREERSRMGKKEPEGVILQNRKRLLGLQSRYSAIYRKGKRGWVRRGRGAREQG